MSNKARPHPWIPAPYEADDVLALQALQAGDANERQQKRALAWIIEKAADTYGEPFRSDADGGERDTSFALGRAYVGRQVVKLLNLSPAIIAKLRKQK